MIKTFTCMTAACDICGEQPANDEWITCHFPSAAEALSEAENQDWWTDEQTGSVLCTARDEQGAHLARAREIAASLGDEHLVTFLTYWPETDLHGRSVAEIHEALREADAAAMTTGGPA